MSEVVAAVTKAISYNPLKDNSETTKQLVQGKLEQFNYDNSKVAEDFVKKNEETFRSITNLATKFTYLGSGIVGDAYDLGNYILKIEVEGISDIVSGEKRSKTAAKELWSQKKDSSGRVVPMIYDQGYLNYNNKKFYWEIKEKFDTKDVDDPTFDLFLFNLNNALFVDTYQDEKRRIEIVKDRFKDFIEQLSSDHRLSSDWLPRLIKDMKKLNRLGMIDFHSGNIGIRRSGGEGYFYFFD